MLTNSQWGSGLPWTWGAGTGQLWRTSTDIVYYGSNPSMSNILGNFDKSLHASDQHTGYYNDPDMLTVGMPGLSADQDRTHLGLWAIAGAPLLAGNNCRVYAHRPAPCRMIHSVAKPLLCTTPQGQTFNIEMPQEANQILWSLSDRLLFPFPTFLAQGLVTLAARRHSAPSNTPQS